MDFGRTLNRAKRIEDAIRERAFLPIGETINGVEVLQFSLRHLTLLFHCRSPLLVGGPIGIEDIGLFLWIVSPHYDPFNKEITLSSWKKRWMRFRKIPVPRIREVFMHQLVCHPKWNLFHRAITRYLERAFMDRPPQCEGGKPIAASYAAGMIHRISRAYSWRPEEIMDMPIAGIFQLLKWIDVEANPKTPQFNPFQDRVKARLINGR